MKTKLSDLWRWDGALDRGSHLLWGVILFATPREWLFRLGVAYPVPAEIHGKGAGAVRHCHFSTGPFVEPIEVWDEPRLLRFSVTANPAPMQEWTPYRDLHPPHLDRASFCGIGLDDCRCLARLARHP